MGEIVSFFKGILMMDSSDGTPVGLCSFEHNPKKKKKMAVKKPARKREMRLSELME